MIAKHACLALFNIAGNSLESIREEGGIPGMTGHLHYEYTSGLKAMFVPIVIGLLHITNRRDGEDIHLQEAAFETLDNLIRNASTNSIPAVVELFPALLERLESMASRQPLSVQERDVLTEGESLLCSSLRACCLRLEGACGPFSERLKKILLHLLTSTTDDLVREDALLSLSALVQAMDAGAEKLSDDIVSNVIPIVQKGRNGEVVGCPPQGW